jgi:hypothetical protein
MTRLFIAAALAALVTLVTRLVDRRRTPHPLAVRRGALPTQVPAKEVGLGDGPAIITFTESSCRSCQDAIRLIRGPAGAGISVADIEYGAQPELHKQFGIDTVPTTVVVDEKGGVVAGWTGRVDLSELTLALAQVVQSELD